MSYFLKERIYKTLEEVVYFNFKEMIVVVNSNELEDRIEKYIDTGNYSRPLIIIGYTGIGKTDIVQNVLQRKGLHIILSTPSISIADTSQYQALEFCWNVKTMGDLDIRRFETDDLPTFLEITVEFEGEVRKYVERSFDDEWLVYRQSSSDWISWAKTSHEIAPDAISLIESGVVDFSSNISRDKTIKQKIDNYLSACLTAIDEKNGGNIIGNFEKALSNIMDLTISPDEIRSYVLPIISKWKSVLPDLSDEEKGQSLALVMSTNKLINPSSMIC